MKKSSPVRLTNNPFWTRKYMTLVLVNDAKLIVTGDDADPKSEPRVSNVQQQYYDLAIAKDPEIRVNVYLYMKQ